ncbi:MAG: hypothetical protein NTX25_13190, partial [Proteobacteria bacterium]|nr:hypothetical protein [Pseudomonadota bacterium]
MPQIISLGFGPSSQNFDRVLRFAGKNIHVTHFAVDFDEELLLSLVKRYEKECDVLAISGLPPPIYTQKRALKHRLITQIEQLVQSCPLVTGHILRSTVMDWGLQHATENNLLQVKDKTLTVLCGLSQWELVQSLEAQAKDVYCLDPMLHYRLKLAVKGQKELETYARTSYPILYKRPIEAPGQLLSLQPNRFNPRLNAALEADLFIGTSSVVSRFDCRAFAGKTLLLDEMNEPLAEALRAAQVHNTFWLKPDLEGIGKNLPYAVLEALILLSRSSDEALNQDDVLEFLVNQKITPTLHSLHTERRHPVRRFAFVIHPLSQGDLFRHPLLSPLGYLPRRCNQWIEKGIALVPGVAYGKITGICSTADGGQAEGLIYTLFATPREMLAADPESIY